MEHSGRFPTWATPAPWACLGGKGPCGGGGGGPRSWTPTRVPLGGTLEGLLLQGLAGHLYKGGQGCTLEVTPKSLRQP
jgi:hypothetical protein